MTEYKLVVVGGNVYAQIPFNFKIKHFISFYLFNEAGGVGKSALTIQLIQNQ